VAINLVLGVAIVALSMVLATRWFGPRAGTLAGWITALWPTMVMMTTTLASELPFLAAVLGAWVAWGSSRLRHPLARGAVAGVLLAAASYVRPTALPLAAVIAMGEVLGRRQPWRGQVVQVAAALAVMAVLIAPWTLRNRAVFGTPVLISTNGGANTWMGNSPGTTGFYREIPSTPGLNEAEKDRHYAKLARDYIVGDPLGFAKRTAVKLVRLHERESIGVSWNEPSLERRLPGAVITGLKLAANLFWWGVLLLALVGFGRLATRGEGWRALVHPAVIMWGFFALVYAVTVIQDRYHLACVTSIAALAALAIEWAWDRRANGPRVGRAA
jgi:hypothetical protein